MRLKNGLDGGMAGNRMDDALAEAVVQIAAAGIASVGSGLVERDRSGSTSEGLVFGSMRKNSSEEEFARMANWAPLHWASTDMKVEETTAATPEGSSLADMEDRRS